MKKEEEASREDSEGSQLGIELKSNEKGGGGLQRGFWRFPIKNLIKK